MAYIKLHRHMLDWEWFSCAKTLSVFLYVLLKANNREGNWKGTKIQRGQLITSAGCISLATGLTIQNVRTCLERLVMTKEIEKISTNKFSLITVTQYDFYQCKDIYVTNKQQTTNIQLTTNKKDKKDKNKDNKIRDKPSLLEVKEFFNEKGYCQMVAAKAFDYYDAAGWIDSRNNPVNNWKQKMISVWMKPENLVNKPSVFVM